MDSEQRAIERIKVASEMSLHHYGKPLICTYSGGKDSDVMLELFKRSGVPFEVHHSHTTIDAPQTVYHIRDVFKKLELQGIKCEIEYPKLTMWKLIVKKKMPPTRTARYCCSYLKEGSCKDRMIATGVRWAESNARASRGEYEVLGKTKKDRVVLSDDEMTEQKKEFEQMVIPDTAEIMLMNDNSKKRKFIDRCELKAKTICNPIIEWTDNDIKDFITSEKICINVLYSMGFTRCGCIGCPMAGKNRYFEFQMFPTYQRAYIRAFDKMLEAMRNDGTGRKPKWENGNDVFAWWMEEDDIPGQISFEDYQIM